MGNLTMKRQKVFKEVSALQTAGRFFRRHPSILCPLLFLVILYKYFFSWFSLLVVTSPILLLTGFFLEIILAYGEHNNTENNHVYKKIQKAQNRDIHDNGKSVGGVSLPRIPSSEERIAKHNNNERKTRKGPHGQCSSESGSGASDGSESDTRPMLHAFHQLRSVASSSGSSHDDDSNDSSIEDEAENQEGNDNELEEREGVKVIAWTADDQKNIMKIGCLEIERNQRLETLIARRRARKYVDRNMMDFGSSEFLPTIEELSKFNVQIPTVFAPRKNPFDLPYNEDNFPDSAPSAPKKMRNAFDLQCEQENESSYTGGANSSDMEPIPVATEPQRNAMFRRHESFTEGAPFLSDFWQDLQPSRFRPYFVTEKTAEGITVPSLEGETSEKSSVQESDSTSSFADQESQKALLEDTSNQGQGSSSSQTDQPPSAQNVRESPFALDIESPVLISDSSDDDISLPGGYINDWEEAQDSKILNISHSSPLEDLSVAEYPQEMETTINDFHQMSTHPNDLDSMSSSTEGTEPIIVNNVKLPGKEVEIIHDTLIADPVYDLSPSGSDKPKYIGSAIDAVLLQGNARTLDAEASMEEDASLSSTEVPSSEISAPSLASVEKSKLRENGTSEIRGHGIVHHDGVREDSFSPADPADISSQPTTIS